MRDYSKQHLQKASFTNQDLSHVSFADSDLRGADFTGADLSNADFSQAKTGIPVLEKAMIFIGALAVSLLSGYVAMLAGSTVQSMLKSDDSRVRISGIIASVTILLFIALAVWKGGRNAIRHLGIPIVVVSISISLVAVISGLGTGRGMFYLALSFFLVILMFIVGTIARSAAGSLSNILFIIVALSGGMFGRSLGGGIGTVVMAVACMQISKRAMSGTKGFEWLRKVGTGITSRFGTSFRNARMANTKFGGTKIRNADFTGADTSHVLWEDSKKVNCIGSPG
jgi:uncharacterized protein YjbI with pentapeptide repeats